MPDSSTRPESALWIAMGAALGGVLLGGAAVYVGTRTSDDGGRDSGSASAAASSSAQVDGTSARDLGDEGGDARGPLVQAIDATRDTVVNLRTPGGLGAGVIVDASGIVLTNYHVIADVLRPPPVGVRGVRDEPAASSGVVARMENGRELPAVVLIADAQEDLALLKLQPEDAGERFASAVLGLSRMLAVGQEVFAIGNPFGLTHTVSRGIVSALDRTDVGPKRQVPQLQLDASINIGNSGGPLFNLAGELVGIVTARRQSPSPQMPALGIAFALPIDHVRAFLQAVKDGSLARSGIIGVEIETETPLPAAVTDLGYRAGIVIARVYEGYPAARAGMIAGDVIVEVRGRRFDGLAQDGKPETGFALSAHLQQTVRALRPGEKLNVTVVRGQQRIALDVEVAAAGAHDQGIIDADELMGLVVPKGEGPPLVAAIRKDSPLGRSELASDVIESRIVQMLGRDVKSIGDLGAALAEVRALGERGSASAVSVATVFQRADGRQIRIDLPVVVR